LLIFLLCFNVQKALSNSTSCPADTYPDIYRGGRRDVNHCTTFVLSKELKTTKNMPETKGDNTLLGKMVNFCKYNFKKGQLLSYLNEDATRYHQYYKYPEKEITVHSGTEVGKTGHIGSKARYNAAWKMIGPHDCYMNSAIFFNRITDEISTTHMERCITYSYSFKEMMESEHVIIHPWWQNYSFSESIKKYSMSSHTMCRCMRMQSETNEYKFATPVLNCSADNCEYFACVSESYKNCIEERIEQCTFPPNENICREYTYVRHQEAEIPYGKECPERDYGERCDCPCSDLEWSEWSAKSTTCGPYTRERYKVVKGFENVEVDCTQERYKCCFSIEEGLQTDCKDFFINSNKTIMEHNETCTKNGGTIIKTEAGYFCECDDSRHGILCEKNYTFCEDHPNICQNGGKCFNAGSSYICSCTSDFQGVNCTIPEITCNNGKECLNGGNCSLVDGKHICVCSPVYTGKFCESRIRIFANFPPLLQRSESPKGGRRDVNHCTTFVLSKELKTTKNMPETKGDNTLLGKMVNFCKYNFKKGQLLSYLNEDATRYHQYYKYPEKEITVHSGTEVGKTRYKGNVPRYHEHWKTNKPHACYMNTAIFFNGNSDKISTIHMDRCINYFWGYTQMIDVPNVITHPWWQNYNFSESGNEYKMGLHLMCRCMKIQSETNEYKFATPVLNCSADNCEYFACVSASYKNCIEERIEQCTFPPNENICREYTYVRHQEAEIPYGKECPTRDYGEICDCPCSDIEWSEWSAKSTTCGPYTRERYKVTKEFENVEVDCTEERYKCCFSIEEGLQTDCKDFFINSNKTIMEHNETCTKNGGTIIKTEAGYFCECDDSRHGRFISEITCNNGKECLNGGNCSLVDGKHICVCSPVYTGKFCESPVSTLEEIAITLSNSYVTTVISICSLVAVAFLYLSGKAVRRHRKRRRARYSRQLKAPKEPKTLSTETNL
ncbi:Protocadherin Fat 3, partial [Trichinella sp. T6]